MFLKDEEQENTGLWERVPGVFYARYRLNGKLVRIRFGSDREGALQHLSDVSNKRASLRATESLESLIPLVSSFVEMNKKAPETKKKQIYVSRKTRYNGAKQLRIYRQKVNELVYDLAARLTTQTFTECGRTEYSCFVLKDFKCVNCNKVSNFGVVGVKDKILPVSVCSEECKLYTEVRLKAFLDRRKKECAEIKKSRVLLQLVKGALRQRNRAPKVFCPKESGTATISIG